MDYGITPQSLHISLSMVSIHIRRKQIGVYWFKLIGSWSCSSFFGQLMRDACHEVKVFLWPYCYLLPVKPTWTNAFLGFYFIICLTSVLWDRKLLPRWWEKRQPESDCCVRGLLPVQITKLLSITKLSFFLTQMYICLILSAVHKLSKHNCFLTTHFFLLMMTC